MSTSPDRAVFLLTASVNLSLSHCVQPPPRPSDLYLISVSSLKCEQVITHVLKRKHLTFPFIWRFATAGANWLDRQDIRRPICAQIVCRRPLINPSLSPHHLMRVTDVWTACQGCRTGVSSACGLLPVSSRSHVAAEGERVAAGRGRQCQQL